MKTDNSYITCCTDGIRPVIFKIEVIDRDEVLTSFYCDSFFSLISANTAINMGIVMKISHLADFVVIIEKNHSSDVSESNLRIEN